MGPEELFIQQFEDVSLANSWNPGAALLHLQQAQNDVTKNRGKANAVQGVFTALRVCFGLSKREAWVRLSALRKVPSTTLQEHETEVE